ncbi:ABC transporter permease [Microbacterium sp.]|uniref:ABC transporter permease n=1 Tax=Microbacterium sp. TaxID=51671 RepID=UPI002602F31D|nr:ABC transporter permease [Microbacterium sp.]
MTLPETEPRTVSIGTPDAGDVSAPARRRRLPQAWLSPLLTVPAAALITVFFAIPIVKVVVLSFTDPQAGLDNYEWLFTTPLIGQAAANTLGISLSVTVVCLLMAYPYACLMTIVSDRTRSVLTMLIMVPMWSSILVRTLAWVVLLQDSGPINAVLTDIGLGPVQLIRTPLGVAIGMSQVLLPFMVMPLYSALSRIDRRLITAAKSLGASSAQAFFKVYLPLSRPGIFSGCLTVFILALGFYIIPSLLGSPQDTMISAMIQLQVSGFLQWGRGSALGVVLLVATLVALVLVSRLGKTKRTSSKGGRR